MVALSNGKYGNSVSALQQNQKTEQNSEERTCKGLVCRDRPH